MSAALVTALRDSCGYLQDEGWHQTAQLMTLAADEVERLTERVRELEADSAHEAGLSESLQAPQASNQNGLPLAAIVSARR